MNRKNVARLAFTIVILCFLLSTFMSLFTLRMMAKRNMEEISKTLAARVYDTIGGKLSEPAVVSSTMANDHFLVEFLEMEDSYNVNEAIQLMADYLSRIKNTLGYEAAFVVSEGSKRYYSYGGLNKQLDLGRSERDQWYARFVESGRDYELDVDRDEVGQDHWTVFVDARIESNDGTLLGVCGVGARMEGCQELFKNLENEYGVKISLTDEEGLIHVNTDESKIETEYLENLNLTDARDYAFQKLSSNRYAVTKYVEKLGWYLVVESDGNRTKAELINVVVLNVAVYLFVIVIMILAVRIIIARTKALAYASLVDQPTQLKNRRAFEERKSELSGQELKEDLVYVTADLNGLKKANDTLGHAAGDELIRGAADCLRECFEEYGDVFRIGGDEFAAILFCTEDNLKAALDRLEKRTAEWRGKQVQELSIACGYASSREFPSENIAELSRISDERMYAAKDEYYRQTGKDRRKA